MNELVAELGDEVEYRSVDTSRDPATSREYGVQVLPTTIVLDSAGEVVLFEAGFSNESNYRKTLEEALAEVIP